jgi:RNA polymerase sigma-70 factor (ECF subfamily)
MSDTPSFGDLVRRVRAGDAAACAELVRRYEPAIRVVVHVRLTDPGLRRLFDSMDVCQSVLASFFARAALGQFELSTPEQLVRLLRKMASNRVINHARKHHAAVRDVRRVVQAPDEGQLADRRPSPSEVVANQELLDEVRNRLGPEERRLADQRALGRSWEEIAAETGGSPGALRMRLRRALDLILSQLGLEA